MARSMRRRNRHSKAKRHSKRHSKAKRYSKAKRQNGRSRKRRTRRGGGDDDCKSGWPGDTDTGGFQQATVDKMTLGNESGPTAASSTFARWKTNVTILFSDSELKWCSIKGMGMFSGSGKVTIIPFGGGTVVTRPFGDNDDNSATEIYTVATGTAGARNKWKLRVQKGSPIAAVLGNNVYTAPPQYDVEGL